MQDQALAIAVCLIISVLAILIGVGILMSLGEESEQKNEVIEDQRTKYQDHWLMTTRGGSPYRPGTFKEFLVCVSRYQKNFTVEFFRGFSFCETDPSSRVFRICSGDVGRNAIDEYMAMFDGVMFLFESEADYGQYHAWYEAVMSGKISMFCGKRAPGKWGERPMEVNK